MMLSRGQSASRCSRSLKPSHQWVNYYGSSLDAGRAHLPVDFPVAADTNVGSGGGRTRCRATSARRCRATSERMFDLVDCEALLSAVELGFEVVGNHRFIQFHGRAATARARRPPSCRRGAAGCRRVRRRVLAPRDLDHRRRAAAPRPRNSRRLATLCRRPPRRRLRRRASAATTSPGASTCTRRRQPARARRVELSRIHFNTQTCWYLDNRLLGFHKYAIGPGAFDIEGLVLGSSSPPSASRSSPRSSTPRACSRASRTRPTASAPGRCGTSSRASAGRPLLRPPLRMPPLCYTYIFRPCMDCYDFEAAVAHEIGHILGFHHPDVHPERNWNATVPMSSEICEDSWATAELTGVDLAGSIAADSIMNSLTKQQARACLTLDDLAASTPCPTCDDAFLGINEPVCIVEAQRRRARFAALVAMPFMVCAVFVLILVAYARRRDARFKRIQRNFNQTRSSTPPPRRRSRTRSCARRSARSRRRRIVSGAARSSTGATATS